MSIAWNAASGVNRYFADEALARRAAGALRACERRNPRSWLPLGVNLALAGAIVASMVAGVPNRQSPAVRDGLVLMALVVFVVLGLAAYLWWEVALLLRARRVAAAQSSPGALLTASFGRRALRVTTPDIGYELPYGSVAEVVRVRDVLVLRSTSDLLLALPMELVPPDDLSLLMGKVHGSRPAPDDTPS